MQTTATERYRRAATAPTERIIRPDHRRITRADTIDDLIDTAEDQNHHTTRFHIRQGRQLA